MKKLFISVFGMVLMLSSCSLVETKKSELEKFDWLLGTWSNITEERELYEVWIRVNDTLYSGKSLMIAYQDTVFSETILIQSIGDDIFYIPTVSDQNQSKAIPFKLVSDINGEYIFENKKHDFPQRICYSNPQPDSLYAYVEGEENEKNHKIDFFLKRFTKD